MTIQEATEHSISRLAAIYEQGEAAAISDWVMEHLTGVRKTQRIGRRQQELTPQQQSGLEDCLQRLLMHEPVQYVLGEAWFCGFRFYVDRRVLIPRPETEELVEWIISDCRFPIDQLQILDIGTGSGCIPIALKRRLGKAGVWSCDSSEEALQVAQKNAETLGTDVLFRQLDFLDPAQATTLPSFDIIVSNPPYIPQSGRAAMQPNVLDYEPAAALFVPDHDPLVFYTAIAEFGKTHLNEGGAIYLEIHEDKGADTAAVFQGRGYSTALKTDMQGKERMLKAIPGL
ncbi:MAG: peptide chain release factor N(5)-glutamine methyltransferase [Chitinophagaceae bacterium]